MSLVASGCGEVPDGARETSAPVAGAQSLTRDIFASDIFNWRFYLNAHGDLLQAGIVTEQGARNHWQNNGIRECRRAHPLFHTRQYLDIHPDTVGGSNRMAGAVDSLYWNGRR